MRDKDNFNAFVRIANYCQKCWNEFTTLTDEERLNLKKILQNDKVIKDEESSRKKVYCITNGMVYANTTEASLATGVSRDTVYFACRRYDPNKRKYKKTWEFKYFE